jgi:hypothetical protein
MIDFVRSEVGRPISDVLIVRVKRGSGRTIISIPMSARAGSGSTV